MKFGYMEGLMYEIGIYWRINVWNWDIWKNECMKLGYMEVWMYKGINKWYGNYEMNWDVWKNECIKE